MLATRTGVALLFFSDDLIISPILTASTHTSLSVNKFPDSRIFRFHVSQFF